MARARRYPQPAWLVLVGAMVAALALLATPAAGQLYSQGYKFLQSVKERDAEAVTAAINEPGSTVINSRDLTSGETALHIVVARRDLQWITFLTYYGANPNIRDARGQTPVVLAARVGWVDGVKALVSAGARVDESDAAGETPLIAAVHRRDLPMIRALLEAGADPDRNDNSGRSARDYAELSTSRSTLLGEIERHEKAAGNRAGQSYGPSL